LALITFAAVPLNATSIFCVRESKWSPSITTRVDGGPSRGETRLIVGACEESPNTCGPTAQVPSGFTTTTFAVPETFAGLVTWIVLESMTRPSVPASPAKNTRAPERKFVPLTVTRVPPSTGPVEGLTEIPEG